MKIDMVVTVLEPIGGIESALVSLARQLKDNGHQIRIYTVTPLAKPNQNLDALTSCGIMIFSCPRVLYQLTNKLVQNELRITSFILFLLLPLIFPIAVFDSLVRRRSITRSIRGAAGRITGFLSVKLKFQPLFYVSYVKKLKAVPPDIIHIHGWGCGSDPPGGLDLLRENHIPIVYTEHNSPDPRIHEPIADAPLNLASGIIAVSKAGKEGLIEVGNAVRPIFIVPYPVEPLVPYPGGDNPPRPFTMICVARLHPQKGHIELIQAMSILKAKGFRARLLLAGDGSLRDEIQELIEQNKLSDEVSLLGAVKKDDLSRYYSQADAAILYSYWEGMPLALIEALSLGMPLIVSDVGGNKEIVTDAVNGIIVAPGEPALLAEKIMALSENRPLLDHMRLESKKVFEAGGFSPADVTRSTLDVYRQCLASP